MPVDLTISQGDTSPVLTATIVDQSGNVVNLTSGSVTFVMRQGDTIAPVTNAAATIVSGPAGTVSYTFTATDTATPALYMAQFRCTLSSGATYTFPNKGYLVIEVQENLTNPAQHLVSVADAKDVLNFQSTNTVHDTKILRWINACRPVIETLTGPIVQRVFEEWHDGGHYNIVLKRRPSTALGTTPVLFVNAISEYNGPIEWPLAQVGSPDRGVLYSVLTDINTGRVVRRTAGGGVQAFPAMPQSVHIWYTAGQSSVPDNVYEATLELLRVNYQQTAQAVRRNQTAGKTVEVPAPPTGFFVPNRVRELLGPNRRFPSFA